MQANPIHASAYKSYAALAKKPSSSITSSYTPPSGDVIINTVFEKMAIERKIDEKQKSVELMLAGYGDESKDNAKHASQTSAEMYRAALEGELKSKIAQMARQEQAAKADEYQMSVKLSGYGSFLNLYL